MNRKRAEIQIRAVLVTFRAEKRRRHNPNLVRFRERADAILSELERHVQGEPELMWQVRVARRELRGRASSARTRLGNSRAVAGQFRGPYWRGA